VAVKIKLKRMGKIRAPYYRVVVADSRTKRDGRAIEEIGKYHPTNDPSLIDIDSARAQHWLGVGAQPTEAVIALLKVTGDWQRFKGLPGAEGTLQVAEPRVRQGEVPFVATGNDATRGGRGSAPRAAAATPTAEEPATAPAEPAPAEPAPVEAATAAEAAPVESAAPAEAAPVDEASGAAEPTVPSAEPET